MGCRRTNWRPAHPYNNLPSPSIKQIQLLCIPATNQISMLPLATTVCRIGITSSSVFLLSCVGAVCVSFLQCSDEFLKCFAFLLLPHSRPRGTNLPGLNKNGEARLAFVNWAAPSSIRANLQVTQSNLLGVAASEPASFLGITLMPTFTHNAGQLYLVEHSCLKSLTSQNLNCDRLP